MLSDDHKAQVVEEWARLGPFAACERLGVSVKREGRYGLIQCLWHSDNSPSCSVSVGHEGTLRFHCFSCDQTWDVLSAVAQCAGLDASSDFPRVLVRAAELVGRWDVVDAIEGRETRREAAPLPVRSVVKAEPTKDYPPQAEVEDLLAACVRVDQDRGVWDWLRGRGLDPRDVAVRDLALALPPSCQALPPWARFRGQTWVETGHRLIVPLWDHLGVLRSVRAGRVVEAESPKRLPPSGHRVSGLMMLDAMGREAFKAGGWPTFARSEPRFVVVEGEPDFLTMASKVPLYETPAYAVVGIYAGSWSAEVASVIPSGAKVAVWTDNDQAGDKYAAKILESLSGKCNVMRKKVAA